VAEFWVCEGCYDLTENEPDHRGVVLCAGCGGPAAGGGFIVTVLGDSGVRSLTRAESLTPESLAQALAGLEGTATVLAISTPHSIMVDLARDGQPVADPYEFERGWLAQIGREDLLPADAWETAA
jgi:hypothetical protein